VRQAFPGVRLYKPIDAILTSKERQRASAWGVTLDDEDENTIYVPVQDKRPVGTAIIVKGELANDPVYLLVRTDRQLALTGVLPVHGESLPGSEAAIYQQHLGATADNFDLPEADGPERDIAATIQRGLAIITVRLKK